MPRRRMLREDFDALLSFLPLFEDPEFVFGRITWESGLLPSCELDVAVGAFVEAAYEHGWVYGFDWTDWKEEGLRYVEDPGLVAKANVRILRRLLTMHVRGNRFRTGHLLEMHQKGHLVAILRRMKELRPREEN